MSSGTPPTNALAEVLQTGNHPSCYNLSTRKVTVTACSQCAERIEAAAEIERLAAFSGKLQELCYVLGEGWPIDGGGSELRHTHLTAAQIRPFLQQALIDACLAAEAESPEVAS